MRPDDARCIECKAVRARVALARCARLLREKKNGARIASKWDCIRGIQRQLVTRCVTRCNVNPCVSRFRHGIPRSSLSLSLVRRKALLFFFKRADHPDLFQRYSCTDISVLKNDIG